MSTICKINSLDDTQYHLFADLPQGTNQPQLQTATDSGRRFVTGDPTRIYLGTTRLDTHLKHCGQTSPFIIARLLNEQNWQPFESRYAATGRAPYAPRLVMGLILYGVMQGIHSLRELERLARLDLGCMWITGGIAPDHANIGRFITLHDDLLSGDFFESLTGDILKACGTSNKRLAGDGTVIEAACSHYKLLKEEAIRERAAAADKALKDKPDDTNRMEQQQTSQHCLKTFEERAAARACSGNSTDTLRVSPTEPEAMVQRLKRGRGFAASYQPSVLSNADRIITAQALDVSSETKVIGALLDQSSRVIGTPAEELLLDAGYFDDSVIKATLDRDVSLLCPESTTPGEPKAGKVFHKSRFDYDQMSDSYRCPAGEVLILLKHYPATADKREYRRYGSRACKDCAMRADCTKTKKRRLMRYPEDEARDALRQVMQQPQVQDIYRQRKAMVEPVFAHLRQRQGLNRFRRSGLKAVKREFALHVLAHNLSRAVALLRAAAIALFYARYIRSKHIWAVVNAVCHSILKLWRIPILKFQRTKNGGIVGSGKEFCDRLLRWNDGRV
jgi:transposase